MKTTIFIAICAASMCCCGSGIAEPNAPVAAAPLFPVEPPIKDADPQVRSNRTFQVPTRLIVKRTPERIEVSVDMNSLEAVELKVGHRMVTGFKHRTAIVSGDRRRDWGGGLSGTTDIGTSYINRTTDGIPKPNEKYVIEVTVIVFEIDNPAAGGRSFFCHWCPGLSFGTWWACGCINREAGSVRQGAHGGPWLRRLVALE